MRAYVGYPDSIFSGKRFRVKDVFIRERGIDYGNVPVEVRRKLLSALENLNETDYVYIGDVFYDAADVVKPSIRTFLAGADTVVLPGYMFGKEGIFRKLMGKGADVCFDFNLFPEDAVVLNVGYRQSSISFGGNLLSVFPIGEFNFIDTLGSYLFNRFLLELGASNAELRSRGMRGKLLDRFRSFAGRILFKGEEAVLIEEFGYERAVGREEVELVLSPLLGRSNYGDFVENPVDISSLVVDLLYRYEETFRERFPARAVFLIGRLTFPFKTVLERIFPVPVKVVGDEILELPVREGYPEFLRRIFPDFPGRSLEYPSGRVKGDIRLLRSYFNRRDIRGLSVIESLVEEGGDERLIYELISIIRRCSNRSPEEIAFMNFSICALSRVEIPERLYGKVLEVIVDKAFDWLLPFETKRNILYLFYRMSGRVRDERIRVYAPLLLTCVRGLRLSEGERNFLWTASRSIFNP